MKKFVYYSNKFLNILKKIFVVITVYITIVSLFVYFTKDEQEVNSYNAVEQTRKNIYKKISDPKLNATKEGKKLVSFYRLVSCSLIGEACTNNPKDGDKNFNKSFFGFLVSGVVIPYRSPPASGVYWAYSSLEKAGFVPKSYAAQGIGFAAMKPIADLWKIFRDAALTILVIVVVTIGFLIMFRVKINPQTVISLENALPRIVITIIFIVFSYAIAGLLIDFMYVIIAIFASLLNRGDAIQKFLTGGTGLLFGEIFWTGEVVGVGAGSGIGNSIFNLMPSFLSTSLRFTIVVIFNFLIGAIFPAWHNHLQKGDVAKEIPFGGGILGFIISLVISGVVFAVFPSWAGVLLSVIILITTGLMVFFRIFFSLLMAYIKIILFVIFGPIILLLNAVPGKNFFGIWIKNITANLLAFPITAILILVSSKIIQLSQDQSYLWSPPFLYGDNPGDFAVLIGVGILFMIPNVIKMIREALGIKSGKAGIGAGLFFGGVGGGMAAFQKLTSMAYGYGSLHYLPVIGKMFPNPQKQASGGSEGTPPSKRPGWFSKAGASNLGNMKLKK